MKRTIVSFGLVLVDALTYLVSFGLTNLVLRLFDMQDNLGSMANSGRLYNLALPVILIVIAFATNKVYQLKPHLFYSELKAIFRSVLVAGLFIHILLYLFEIRTIKTSVTLSLLIFLLLAPIAHYYFRVIAFNLKILRTRVVIIGESVLGKVFEETVTRSRFTTCEVILRVPSIKEIRPLLGKLVIDEAVVAIPNADNETYQEVMRTLEASVPSILLIPDNLFRVLSFSAEILDFNQVLTIHARQGLLSIPHRKLKRLTDVFFGIIGLAVLIPLYVVVAILIKLEDGGPVIFKQRRIGPGGHPIDIYKFRTMVPNAEAVLRELMEKDPAVREEYSTCKKLKNDPRITKVGRFLRNTSLDEFPQFLNVLKSDMSFVGPRPYLFSERDDMGECYYSVIKMKPGITGLWQAGGRNELPFPERVVLDQYYIRNWTIWFDFVIVLQTIRAVLMRHGAQGM